MILSIMKASALCCLLVITILTSSSGQITINESKHFIIGSDTIPTEGSDDTLFYYNHAKRALRVGIFENGLARENITANGSTAFGRNNQAGGSFSTAFGSTNLVQGTSSMIWGRNNKNFGSRGTVWGFSNEARDNNTTVWGSENDARQESATSWGTKNTVDATLATAWGEENTVTASRATVMGLGNNSVSPSSLTIGEYSKPFDSIDPSAIDSLDFLFAIGNGKEDTLSNAMIVNRIGRVGIGTDFPKEALHIKAGKIRIGDDANISSEGDDLITNASILPIRTDLNIGSPSQKWGTIYADNGVIQTSDIRFKTNIYKVDNVLEKVLQLEPINYNLTTTNDNKVHTGLSAQAVEKLFPSIVSKTKVTNNNQSTDQYGINYSELIPVLIKAIQEQQVMIDELKQNQ